MKFIQFTGPFSSGQTIHIPAQQNYEYIHIGIQIPKRQPIQYRKEPIMPELSVNGKDFVINENGILEFDGLAELAWDIEFHLNLPMEAIIDIAYTVKEN